MLDGYLLKLFNFNKSLEEIDKMNISRLRQAVEALNIAKVWEFYHSDRSLKERHKYAGQVFELKEIARKYGK